MKKKFRQVIFKKKSKKKTRSMFALPCLKSFGQAFSKACAVKGAEPLSPRARGEIFSSALFFLLAFSFAPLMPKEKAGSNFCFENGYSINRINLSATFLFDTKGAKRKVIKRETPRIGFALCGARGGLCALHRMRFLKKAHQKLLYQVWCEQRKNGRAYAQPFFVYGFLTSDLRSRDQPKP